MGAVAWTVVSGIVAGLSAAAPWMVYADRVVPSLTKASARPPAYFIAAIPAVVASVLTLARLIGFTTGSLRDDIVLIAATVGVACSWGPIVRVALSVTGGPAAMEAPIDHVRTVGAVPLANTLRTLGFALGVSLFLATMTAFAVPAMASFVACLDTEAILADAEPPVENTAPLRDAIPYNPPEALAQSMLDFPMSLDLAAESRSDPNAREQLLAAGYVGGHVRSWLARDGAYIEGEVMEFGTPEGAATYQGQVNRYACGYANEAFEAPMGGIGLQVRYETGAPYLEQISWVAGDRRYKVQVSAYDRPSHHDRILELQRAFTATWPPADPPAAAEPTPSPSPMEPAGPDAIDVVRTAVETTRAEGSVWIGRRAEFDGSSEIPDESTAYAGGQVGLSETRRMKVMVQAADDPSDLEASSMEVILDDARILVRGRSLGPSVPAGEWLAVDLASEDPRAGPFKALVSGHNDPSLSFFYLYGVTRVIGESDGIVHEQRARKYTVVIDLEAALDALPPEHVDSFRTRLAELKAAGFLTDFEAEVWVAEDGLVHYVSYVQPLSDGVGGGTMRATVDLFDFGLPLALDLPPPEHVNPIEDVKDPLGTPPDVGRSLPSS